MAEEAIINNEVSVHDQWGQICSQLKLEFGETAFDSWLKPLSIGSFTDGVMNICVPTTFMKNWVITHYSERIHKIWENKNPNIKKVNFVVQTVNTLESAKQDNSLTPHRLLKTFIHLLTLI